MYKKFVSLNSNQSPSKNPYEVRTFLGEQLRPQHPQWRTETCVLERDCSMPQNSNIAKVLTLEDEIRKIQTKTQEKLYVRPFKKSCQYDDHFVACVATQRTPYELKRNAVKREQILKIEQELHEFVHDAGDIYLHDSLIKLKDPFDRENFKATDEENANEMEESDDGIMPEIASPQCSMDYIYIPPKRLLELNRPKSGIYVNETHPPNFYPSDDIPYSTYNPRVLQEQFDKQSLKQIDVIAGKTTNDLWTWNVGLQQKKSDLNRCLMEADVAKFDCDSLDLFIYKIPKDLDKTFSAAIVFGTKAVVPEIPSRKKSRFNRPTEMACMYLAYVERFRLNADFWTIGTMDNIIKMAQKLIDKSVYMNYKSQDTDYDIIPQIAERQASINIKVHFMGPLKGEPNIYKALSVYFSKYNACILCSNNLYLLIWKRCKNFYYIYDPNGRANYCERDLVNGKCALISTHLVEHLVHLIVNISQTNLEDEYHLYEIYLTSFGSIPNPLPKNPFPKTFHKKWSVVNDSYAVIPGCNNGLFQPTKSTEHNASMLISVMAILYSHIERGNCWKTEQIDELIRLGTAYYKSLRRKLKLLDNQHVTITDLPDKYVLGTYKASLKKSPFMYAGTLTDYCKRYNDSLLSSGMKQLFNNEWEAALLQIDNSILGVWRDSELFYVYDPFRRGKAGQVLDPEDYKTSGVPLLQMHANFESFLRILYQKCLKMRRGGKFFLHALNVGCIKPIMDGKPRKLRYPKLKLTPETYVTLRENTPEEDDKPDVENKSGEENIDEGKENNKNREIQKKDQRSKDKNKKKKLEKVCSIESLDVKERIPDFEDSEVVESLLEDIICEIVNKFPESLVGPKRLYKQAGRVLLRSDKDYLEKLKYLVTHDEDYDNVETNFRTEPKSNTLNVTLEEELQIPSNFQTLLDGSWIIFGVQFLTHLDEEQSKLRALLAAIVTVALSDKYKISTWSSKLIDYAVNSGDSFGEDFKTYQYALGALIHNKIPKLAIGDRTLQVSVQKLIKSDAEKSLRHVLLETLNNFNRLLVICQRFCCLVLKRNNFVYMFTGFPNNAAGYRKRNSGPACLLRFIELDSLVGRIEYGCYLQGCNIIDYVLIPVKAMDITPESMGRYRQCPEKVEDLMYHSALEQKKREEESKSTKLKFLDAELDNENQRIREFLELKTTKNKNTKQAVHAKSGTLSTHEPSTLHYGREAGGEDSYNDDSNKEEEHKEQKQECIVQSGTISTHEPSNLYYGREAGGEDSYNDDSNNEKEHEEQKQEYIVQSGTISTHEPSTLYYGREAGGEDSYNDDSNNEEEHEEQKQECIVQVKHEFGTELAKASEEYVNPTPILYGYHMRERDLLYKIQGSKALEGRDICEVDKIKPCLFASCLAILYAILKPLNEWTSQRIDQVIDSCLILSDTIEDMSDCDERILKNVVVDDYKFDVWVRGFEPIGLIGNLYKQFERVTSLRKYLIMKTGNCSYVIYRDEYFHLFDPYPSMQLMELESEDEQQEFNENKKKLKYPKDIKLYRERNTASWILFADVNNLLKYIDQRSCSSSWKEEDEYAFLVVDIISYKKSPQSSNVLQLLTGLRTCKAPPEQDKAICADNESMSWLEQCLPMWSRLNRRNSAGRYRGMTVSKFKNYDIEIENHLWSLWGNLHPQAPVFAHATRGKQYLACCVSALCAARLYRLADWSSQLLDSIIINGDRYLEQSMKDIKCEDYQFSLEDLKRECYLDHVKFVVHVEPTTYGKLYAPPLYNCMNLAEGLMYFFNYFQFGILQCFQKCLAIGYVSGHDGGYFMYDCQSRDHPLFPKGQGASYVLRTKNLQMLLKCIVVTLNIPYYNIKFTLHKVDILFNDQSVDDVQNTKDAN